MKLTLLLGVVLLAYDMSIVCSVSCIRDIVPWKGDKRPASYKKLIRQMTMEEKDNNAGKRCELLRNSKCARFEVLKESQNTTIWACLKCEQIEKSLKLKNLACIDCCQDCDGESDNCNEDFK